MGSFTEYASPILLRVSKRRYVFVWKYTVTNFNTPACTVPPPQDPICLNRVLYIDHVDVRYTQSATSYDPVKAYLSLYPAGSGNYGQQKATQFVDCYDKYLVWNDLDQWLVITSPSTYFAAIAVTGYTTTDDMHCRVVGHFDLTDEELAKEAAYGN